MQLAIINDHGEIFTIIEDVGNIDQSHPCWMEDLAQHVIEEVERFKADQ